MIAQHTELELLEEIRERLVRIEDALRWLYHQQSINTTKGSLHDCRSGRDPRPRRIHRAGVGPNGKNSRMQEVRWTRKA